jgi:hypothetical protein
LRLLKACIFPVSALYELIPLVFPLTQSFREHVASSMARDLVGLDARTQAKIVRYSALDMMAIYLAVA